MLVILSFLFSLGFLLEFWDNRRNTAPHAGILFCHQVVGQHVTSEGTDNGLPFCFSGEAQRCIVIMPLHLVAMARQRQRRGQNDGQVLLKKF